MTTALHSPTRTTTTSIAARLERLDADALAEALAGDGYALLPALLSNEDCAALASSYAERALFRSRVVMARHGYGRGEYQYFAYPLPDLVTALRTALYPPLAKDVGQARATVAVEHSFTGKALNETWKDAGKRTAYLGTFTVR